MQKLISQSVPAQYFPFRSGAVTSTWSTSAALVIGSMTIGGGSLQNSLFDVSSNNTGVVLTKAYQTNSVKAVMDPATEQWLKFQTLVKQWHDETAFQSSMTYAAMMPSYQKIIGMGEIAIPLILRQLRCENDEPNQWFWALGAITGANPVSPADQGNVREMARAWLNWGETEGYV